jgi:SAM-dependent methyltransferase
MSKLRQESVLALVILLGFTAIAEGSRDEFSGCAAKLMAKGLRETVATTEVRLGYATSMEQTKVTYQYKRTNRDWKMLRKIWNIKPRLNLLAPNSLQGKHILDVGAGGGALASDIRRFNALRSSKSKIGITAIDIAPKPRSGVMKGDAFHLDFQDNTFDVYHSWESVFSYVSGDGNSELRASTNDFTKKKIFNAVFDEAVRVTKPGGYILFNAAASDVLMSALNDSRVKVIYAPIEHDGWKYVSRDPVRDLNEVKMLRVVLRKK